MSYSETQYVAGLMFCEASWFHDSRPFASAMESLTALSPSPVLYQKVVLFPRADPAAIAVTRRRRYSTPDALSALIDPGRLAQVGVNVFGPTWTATTPPDTLIQAYTAATSLDGRTFDHVGPLRSFLLTAFSRAALSASSAGALRCVLEAVFQNLGGVRGGIYESTTYTLPGGSPMEWAYRNLPQPHTQAQLRAWNPEFTHEFAVA